MFEQRIIDNDDDRFPGLVLIAGYQDGVEVWRSWAAADLDPAVRLNIDHPTAADERTDTPAGTIDYRVPDTAEFTTLCFGSYNADEHLVVATYAAVVESVTIAAAALACGQPEQALIDEANAWAAAAMVIG